MGSEGHVAFHYNAGCARRMQHRRDPTDAIAYDRAARRDCADHGRGPLLRDSRRRRQDTDAALSGADARMGSLRGAGACDRDLAAAPNGNRAAAHEARAVASRARRAPADVVALLLQLAQIPAARRSHGDELFDAGAGDDPRRGLSPRANDAAADRARHLRARGNVPHRAARLRDVPGRRAALARRRALLRGVPDPDAQARERGLARAAVLSRDRRHRDDDGAPAVVRRSPRRAVDRHRAHHRHRSARHARPRAVRSRVSAQPRLGADALHVHPSRLGDAPRMACLRSLPRRVDACRHGGDRRQRPPYRVARAAARKGVPQEPTAVD